MGLINNSIFGHFGQCYNVIIHSNACRDIDEMASEKFIIFPSEMNEVWSHFYSSFTQTQMAQDNNNDK